MLQTRLGITQGPVRYLKKEDHRRIMKTCTILHNMIIEDEHGIETERWKPPPDESTSPPEYTKDPNVLVTHIASRLTRIRCRETYEH